MIDQHAAPVTGLRIALSPQQRFETTMIVLTFAVVMTSIVITLIALHKYGTSIPRWLPPYVNMAFFIITSGSALFLLIVSIKQDCSLPASAKIWALGMSFALSAIVGASQGLFFYLAGGRCLKLVTTDSTPARQSLAPSSQAIYNAHVNHE